MGLVDGQRRRPRAGSRTGSPRRTKGGTMKLTELFRAELEREGPRTRRALERVPQGRDDWKPHPKSMPLGRLAGLVASMPSWVTLIIEQKRARLESAGRRWTVSTAGHQSARRDSRASCSQGSRVALENDRRLSDDDEVAVARWRKGCDGNTEAYRSARYLEPSRASSGSAHRLPAPHRSSRARHLRAIS